MDPPGFVFSDLICGSVTANNVFTKGNPTSCSKIWEDGLNPPAAPAELLFVELQLLPEFQRQGCSVPLDFRCCLCSVSQKSEPPAGRWREHIPDHGVGLIPTENTQLWCALEQWKLHTQKNLFTPSNSLSLFTGAECEYGNAYMNIHIFKEQAEDYKHKECTGAGTRMGPGTPPSSLHSSRDQFPWLQEPGLERTFSKNKIMGDTDNSWPVWLQCCLRQTHLCVLFPFRLRKKPHRQPTPKWVGGFELSVQCRKRGILTGTFSL